MGRKKHVLVWILITILLMVAEYFVYTHILIDKLNVKLLKCPKCDENVEDTTKEDNEEEEDSKCKGELRERDQALFTGIGMIFVSKDGDVYYEPKSYYDPGTVFDGNNLEEIAKKTFGDAQKYQLKSEEIFNMSFENDKKDTYEFNGYKLDLNNIKSVFYSGYGNSSSNYVFAFVSYNGKVSIMKFENNELLLPKKLSEYADITTVTKSSSEAGSGLLFIDKCGNKYFYTP